MGDYRSSQRFWPSAEAFYRERDHRTILAVKNLGAFAGRPTIIAVDPATGADGAVQRAAMLAANLTARWCRRVTVVLPEVSLSPELNQLHDGTLGNRIRREMAEADPFGEFAVRSGEVEEGGLRLFIGPWDNPSVTMTQSDYVVDAAGWSAIGHRGDDRQIYQRPLATGSAAALAGALGAGDLFKRAIGHSPGFWLGTFNWCTWSHRLITANSIVPPPAAIPDLGRMLLAGVGAVGSAVCYVLTLAPFHGEVGLLDRDVVETSNLNRSPLFSAEDAGLSRRKTEVAAAWLRRSGVEPVVLNGLWREHSEALSRAGYDVWVSLTNEDGAWAEVPHLLPPVVLHGTTTSGWGFGMGRHIPRIEDCTMCRLPRPHAEFRGPCAEGEVPGDETTEPVLAALPFLSAAAGALIVGELTKLGLPQVAALPNSVSADLLYGLRAIVSTSRGPSPGCSGCNMSNLSLWLERGGQGRYGSLSRSARA